MSETARQLNKWFMSGKTGSSSKAIATHLSGEDCDGSYPIDAGDLVRCIGLLETVPEFRSRLPEMAAVNKYWVALVSKWGDLEACRSDYKKCSAMMRDLLRPLENEDPNFVRLGEGLSMRFGGKVR